MEKNLEKKNKLTVGLVVNKRLRGAKGWLNK